MDVDVQMPEIGADGSDIVCCVCYDGTSDEPNEIVICDRCNIGYHQRCHDPEINATELLPDLEWVCRRCTSLSSIWATPATSKTIGVNLETVMNDSRNTQRTFPYDPKSLTWDSQHKYNLQQIYCYCGGPAIVDMLQCNQCRQLFHSECIFKRKQPLLLGDRFFTFICAICNHGTQYLKRLELKWLDVVHLTLYNLNLKHNKTYYEIDGAILPFIKLNFKKMLLIGEINSTNSMDMRTAVLASLKSNRTRFKCGCETKKKTSLWGLRAKNPPPVTKVPLIEKQAQKMTSSFCPLPSLPQTEVLQIKKITESNRFRRRSLKQNSKRSLLNLSNSSKNVRNLKPNTDTQKTISRLRKCVQNATESTLAQSTSKPVNKFASSRNCTSTTNEPTMPLSTISLNTMIPPPENFDGINNPFKNFNRRPTVSQLLINKGQQYSRTFYRQSSSITKRKNKLLNFNEFDCELKENDHSNCQRHDNDHCIDDKDYSLVDCKEKFEILARRVTVYGEVQYLIEWEGIGSERPYTSNCVK